MSALMWWAQIGQREEYENEQQPEREGTERSLSEGPSRNEESSLRRRKSAFQEQIRKLSIGEGSRDPRAD